MAVVYEAQHLSLDRRAALKVLDLHGNSSDLARMRERFEREAKLSAKVTHPNVVTIYDHGFVEGIGQPYIAMEFLEGHDLYIEHRLVTPALDVYQMALILRDPGSEEARHAMTHFRRVYTESRTLIKTDASLRPALEEAKEIIEANKELLEELDEIDTNRKWDDETKRYKRISARGWSVTHYFWLTRGLEFG